jgi:hypothetical protein
MPGEIVGEAAMAASSEHRSVRNFIAYALLVGVLVGVHFILAANPEAAKSAAQAAVFSWMGVGVVAACGLFGTFFLNLAPLPGMWESKIGLGQKLVAPIFVGLILGAAEVATDHFTGWGAQMAAAMKMPTIHIAWPLSVPIYGGGAILVSIIYFLTLLPFLVWLISSVLLRGRGVNVVYWLVALPLAVVEPLTQGDFSAIPKGGAPAAAFAVEDLALNLAQVWFFRRAGFIAAVLVRVAFYGVWHVAWGWWQSHGGG